MSTPDIAAAMATAMDTEDRRREPASQTPGLGAPVSLPDVPYGPGVGLTDVGLPHVGEGYGHGAPAAAQSKAYGPDRPQYGHSLIGGLDYAALDARPALGRSRLYDLAGAVFAGQDGPAGRPFVVVSPPAAKPGLLARLAARLRRR